MPGIDAATDALNEALSAIGPPPGWTGAVAVGDRCWQPVCPAGCALEPSATQAGAGMLADHHRTATGHRATVCALDGQRRPTDPEGSS